MKNTLEGLDYLGQLINRFHSAFDENTRSLIGEPLQFFQIISDEINSLKQDGLISENMAKSYIDVLQDMHNNAFGYSDDTEERFYKLHEINNQQTEDCEKAGRKLSEAFQFKWKNDGKDAKKDAKDTNDSKKELEHIKDLMRFYESSYANSDALESVDGLAELVNGIKEAAENKFISESTAKILIEPLQEIKDNIFNDEIHKQKMSEFNDVLQQKISNSKDSKSNTLESIIDGIKSLRSENKEEKTKDSPLDKREDQRTKSVKDVAQKQDDVDKTLENQRQASKENSGKGNEGQEKALREQVEKNKEEKSEKDQTEPDRNVEKLKSLMRKYGDIYKQKGSILYEDVLDVWKEMSDTMNYVIEHKLVSDDIGKQLIDAHSFLRTNGLKQDLQLEGIDRLNNIFKDKQEKDLGQNTATQEQKFEDRIRREDVPSFREGVNAIIDKHRNKEQDVITKNPEIHHDQIKEPKAFGPRTVDEIVKPKEEQKSQDKFAVFREQLKPKESVERKENSDTPKIDKPAPFKAGIENTKKLAENRQKAVMKYYMKKREMEWDDH